MITDFDLTTKDGIEQAKRYIAKQRRDAAINELHAAFDAEEDTEALENRLKEIRHPERVPSRTPPRRSDRVG